MEALSFTPFSIGTKYLLGKGNGQFDDSTRLLFGPQWLVILRIKWFDNFKLLELASVMSVECSL